MCVIIDANLAGNIFQQPVPSDFSPLLDWLQRDGYLVLGGRLADELARLGRAQIFFLELKRVGRAVQVPTDAVDQEEKRVEALGLCVSNDCHVLALARVSGARTICTLDRALQKDVRNPQLISNPRGSVYQRRSHSHLLKHTRSCGRLPRRR